VVVPGHEGRPPARRYNFEAKQPVRYLACLISRLVRAGSSTVSLVEPLSRLAATGTGAMPADPLPAGSFNSQLELVLEANPRQVSRARQSGVVAADIVAYYTSIIGDSPYPDLTLALVEKDLPGGHSPAYLAVLYQPLPTAASSWSGDPAAFIAFPEYFIAHETAHQWWGQAVGWRTYHDQWISEGFAQYFSALYAGHRRGGDTFAAMIRRMAKWSRDQGKAGPISLGYRLGHIQGDSRIFRAIVYNKSAVVLHMLRRRIGDDAFSEGSAGSISGRASAARIPAMCGRRSRKRAARISSASSTPGSTARGRRRWPFRGRRQPTSRSGRWPCASSSAAKTASSPSPSRWSTRAAPPKTPRSSSASGPPSSGCRSRGRCATSRSTATG
jgi:hypothetical protein